MSLVYFVTSLPRLQRGAPVPIQRSAFIRAAREHLSRPELRELERLLLLEEVEAGVRIQANALLSSPDATGDELSRLMYDRPPATEGGPRVSDLPEWLHRPRPLRTQLRRFWHDTWHTADSIFLREWSDFIVNFWEVVTGLLCKRAGLGRDAFLRQMNGSFDTTALYLIERYDQNEAGLRDRFPWVPDVISALDGVDAQDAERALHDVRWQAIEQFADIAPFSVDTVLAYYLRLRIVEAEAGWDLDAGSRVIDAALDVATELIEARWNTAVAHDEAEAA